MLESVKIQRRQSEIRQQLATLVGKDKPTEEETRSMETLDAEYRANETRYRAALIAEDTERREADEELETRSDKEWSDLVSGFELRQAVLALDEGRALSGRTAEVVQELRNRGGYRGIPVPFEALEIRVGETIASGVVNPVQTHGIIDRLFPASVAAQMGVQSVNIGSGETEYPVATSGVTTGWAATELGNVGGPSAFATTERSLKPNSTLGAHMRISRKALKQTAGLEEAIRRDMAAAIGAELDKAVFLGAGSSGQPLGIIPGAATYGITSTPVAAMASWSAFRSAVVAFLTAHAAASPKDVRLLIRPEVWAVMDGIYITGTAVTEFDRLSTQIAKIVQTANALAAPAGDPLASTALLTVTAGGVPPAILGLWGGVDLIRDPYSDAQSGGLRLTGLVTADVTVPRGVQSQILTGIQLAAGEG